MGRDVLYHETLITTWIQDEILMKRNSTYNLTNSLQNVIWSITNALEILLVANEKPVVQ